MYGAIFGDLAGSIYEYAQIKKVSSVVLPKNILSEKSFFSDDTILTIAIADAINEDQNYDRSLRKWILKYQTYHPDFTPYFSSSFSPSLLKWARSDQGGFSKGNGAMMRISPVGFLFEQEEEIFFHARAATIPSHNSSEAIFSATLIALIIFYLRKGISLSKIFQMFQLNPKYTPFKKFNTTCSETLENCLYVLANSNDFESAIRKSIQMGGDTDTNASIVGGMAEALYGIDSKYILLVNERIPQEFIQVLEKTNYYTRKRKL